MVNFKNLVIVATAVFRCTLGAPTVTQGDIIPDSYIITLKPTVKAADAKVHIKWVQNVHKRHLNKRDGAKGVERRYDGKSGFQGYAGSFSKATIKAIQKRDDVQDIEPDRVWKLTLVKDPNERLSAKDAEDIEERDLEKRAMINQTGATWGLATVSHRDNSSPGYLYDSSAGSNTYAYVVDTGVRLSHSEFEGRATFGWTGFGAKKDDTHGHGTHVAGTIAGKTYGVAKNAQIVSVKIFDGLFTTTSTVIAGYNWAANDIINKGRTGRAAINLSIGGGFSSAFNGAINAAFKSGVISVAAAGNANSDAWWTSPASATGAIAVGAIDSSWNIATFSNWGNTVRIFAPGVGVKSAWFSSDTATVMMSGTSMATPHVVGLILSAFSVNKIASVNVITFLTQTATASKITGNLRGAANLIGNNGNLLQLPLRAPVKNKGQS
ncbi:peptidase S8/S53 domain-containing protein [Thelonectria olida]|uniref:Peptidase S8/S53 domain-containing protein n=1 Tax=Thelonectria olida TaxID=1576542 RepID=A0A9P9AVT4_9HYPO|nr:peptidase S8/S53 domain-containing protein [Thelonectria olida]